MPLTLEQYDHQVGFHLRMMQHHARMIVYHVDSLALQPPFETVAQDDLERADAAMAKIMEQIFDALQRFKEKPVDA